MAPKLSTLSVERVWSELRRLMMAPDPAATLDLMAEAGVLLHVLPEASSRSRLAALTRLEARHDIPPNTIRRLAAAIEIDVAGAKALTIRLRMATAEARRLALLTAPAVRPDVRGGDGENRLALYRLGDEAYRDLALIGAAGEGFEDGAALEGILSLPVRAPVPAFPLAGRDIRDSGIEEGPRIGVLLDEIEAWWIDGGFVADRAACLDRLRDLPG
jgi:poly(A) polymerase